jgi:hypothetical protein
MRSRQPALAAFLFLLGSLLILFPASRVTAQTLVPRGAPWRYHDAGVDLGQSWRSNSFDASAWAVGPAPLGYGNGDETTVVAGGVLPRPITLYFRHEFVLPNPTGLTALTLRVAGDDGVIVYLNGVEVYRRNMPIGPILYSTGALVIVGGAAETNFVQWATAPYWARAGTNVLAAEVHQHSGGFDDARFDLELVANLPLTLPEIRITSPTQTATLPPGPVRLQVEASDADGYVYLVRYSINGDWVGDSITEPFDFLWSPPASARYRLVAQAYDNSGRRRDSAPIYFQIGNSSGLEIVRGPYLQSGSSTSMVVRWRTDWPEESVVYFGDAPSDLTRQARGQYGFDHEVKLTGLQPETTYYYGIGGDEGPQPGGFGPDFRFTTAPARTKPFRVWAIGDSGTAGVTARSVRDAYYDLTQPTDVWLMLGDNAYEEGTDDQYQRAVFEMYPTFLRNTVVWPTLGNHDASSVGVNEAFPYLEIFTLPKQGEAGGLASGTELYYSFDYANVHFVCLDAQQSDRSIGGPMLTWLENDLAATAQDWIVAYWHHPPYTWGTHNSDQELQLIEMRANAVPILERYGTDLVLCGHSHVYERTFLLNGHYGFSQTFSSRMIVDGSEGGPAAPYRKPAGGLAANQGTAYVVCGCSGEGGYFPFARHPAMYANMSGFGSMVIDFDHLRMDVRFLTDGGTVEDWFAIDKRAPEPLVRPRLDIRSLAGGVEVSWPTSTRTFQLESRPTVGGDSPWLAVPGASDLWGRSHRWRDTANETNRIYRLRMLP